MSCIILGPLHRRGSFSGSNDAAATSSRGRRGGPHRNAPGIGRGNREGARLARLLHDRSHTDDATFRTGSNQVGRASETDRDYREPRDPMRNRSADESAATRTRCACTRRPHCNESHVSKPCNRFACDQARFFLQQYVISILLLIEFFC